MKKKIFLMALIACLSITNANAGLLKKALFGGGIAALATGAYISTFKHLRENPDEIKPYFEKYPNNFGIMKDILFKESAKPQIETGREQLRRVAEEMGVELPGLPLPPKLPQLTGTPIKQTNIKDYVNTTPVAPSIPNGTILSTPIGNVDIGDLREEFPNDNINSWEDYVLLKQDSTDFSSNIIAAERSKDPTYIKPYNVAAHHIVSATSPETKNARDILEKYLRPNTPVGEKTYNDEINGVLLPNIKNTDLTIPGIKHNGRHPIDYNVEVNDRIVKADTRGSWLEVQNELEKIKQELLNAPRKTKWKDVL